MIQERKLKASTLYGSFKSLFGKEKEKDVDCPIKLSENYELMLAETILINQVLKANNQCDKVNYQYAASVLKREHGLDNRNIKDLFLIANDSKMHPPSLKQSARTVRDQCGHEKLAMLLEGLWLVAVANGKIAQSERSSITTIAHAVGLDDKENRDAQLCATRRSRVMQTTCIHE